MITLRVHTAEDYEGLPPIDSGDTGIINEADQACLDAFGDLLAECDATDRFGASLLHNHFPILPAEVMVEDADASRGIVFLRPKKIAADTLYPFNMCFDLERAASNSELIGLEYTPVLHDTRPVGPGDEAVIEAVHALLRRHGMLRRFGLRLLHDPLRLGDDLALLESCDSKERALTCMVVQATAPDFLQSVPTVFRWEVDPDTASTAQACRTVRRCNVVQGCLMRPDGGHESHGSHEPEESHESVSD